MLAIIAGRGRLPALLAAERPQALVCVISGGAPEIGGRGADMTFRIERLMPFIAELKAAGVREVCFAGAATRPALDPAAFDPETAALAPRFAQAMRAGDDGTLKFVLNLFAENGFAIRAAHEILPGLLPGAGVHGAVSPDAGARTDADRAAQVIAALGAADVGQGCVVQQGQVLAVEALPGTDWMLARLADAPFAARPDPSAGRGLFFKAPKPGQDRRIDLPVIGCGTVAAVKAAGLGGIVIDAGGVMVLDMPRVVSACDAAGLFLWVRGRG